MKKYQENIGPRTWKNSGPSSRREGGILRGRGHNF